MLQSGWQRGRRAHSGWMTVRSKTASTRCLGVLRRDQYKFSRRRIFKYVVWHASTSFLEKSFAMLAVCERAGCRKHNDSAVAISNETHRCKSCHSLLR